MVTNVQYSNLSSEDVVTLEMAKKQLKIEDDFDEDDDLIQQYIDAALEYCEAFIGGAILKRDMAISMDAFDSPIEFEFFPVQSVTTVKYFDESNAEQTMPDTNYSLTSLNPKVFKLVFKGNIPNTYDRFDAVKITASVGYDAGEVPKRIIQVILLKVSDMYEKREDRSEITSTVGDGYLKQFKKY